MNWIERGWSLPVFLLIAIGLGWLIAPEHPDSSYLRARYAQNLVNGAGFVYNPDEDILLTSAPLMVAAHALVSLPTGEVTGPPVTLNLVILAFGAFFLMQILLRENIRVEIAFTAATVWLLGGFITFGGVEMWLASFGFAAFFLADEHPRWAGLVAGLMLLIAPLAIFFVIALGERKFWHLAFFPALMWYAYALASFDLESLTLNPAPGEGFPGTVSLLILVPLILWLATSRPSRAMILVLWGLGYSLVAVIFNLTSDATLLISAGVILAACSYLTPRPPLQLGEGEQSPLRAFGAANLASAVIFMGVIFLALFASDGESLSVPDLDGTKGHIGSNEEAFLLGGRVIHLSGERNTHLRELIESGDSAGVIIASAPDFLLIDALPDDPSLNLLGYRPVESAFQRSAEVFPWDVAQSVQIDFGPDMRLTSLQQDRTQTNAGGILRLRLDWQILSNHRPEDRLLFIFQILDRSGGVVGSVEQAFPPEKWREEHVTSYHVLPINDDTPPGLYDVRLTLDLDAGIIDRRVVTQVKVPAPTDVTFDEAPLARFDNGSQMADLMIAGVSQSENEILLDLTWRAGSSFEADYTIFVHLTPPDDPMPLVQADAQPRYPTSIWAEGEVIETSFIMPLMDVPPGDYVIRVGFFHPGRGRIPINGGDAYVIELD